MKRFTSFLLALTIIVGQISIVFANTKEAKLDISSKSAVLMDASTGKILYEKNSICLTEDDEDDLDDLLKK